MVTPREKVLFQGRYDEKWKMYCFLNVLWVLLVMIVGIPAIPFWLLFGMVYCNKAFAAKECLLCEASLVVGHGVFFKTEKTIPLDKIQDLTLKEGPLLKAFGLCSLKVETAGQSAPQGGSDADLVGLRDARGFRDRVLDQRDAISKHTLPEVSSAHTVQVKNHDGDSVLADIRDTLHRIEDKLTAAGPGNRE